MTDTDLPGPWDGRDGAALVLAWQVPAVCTFEAVGSTNDVARALARGGVAHGTVVLAERQTRGRGRGGHGWVSAPGVGIWLSVLLRAASRSAAALLPIRVGLGIAEQFDRYTSTGAARVKWPNDVYLTGRKCAGILCEAVWQPDGTGEVVVGVGVNVAQRRTDFPPELRHQATSLAAEGGAVPSRAEIAGGIVAAVLAAAARADDRLGADEVARLRARDFLAGRHIAVSGAAAEQAGIARGIAADGALLLEQAPGAPLVACRAGSVRLLGEGHDPAPLAEPVSCSSISLQLSIANGSGE